MFIKFQGVILILLFLLLIINIVILPDLYNITEHVYIFVYLTMLAFQY